MRTMSLATQTTHAEGTIGLRNCQPAQLVIGQIRYMHPAMLAYSHQPFNGVDIKGELRYGSAVPDVR